MTARECVHLVTGRPVFLIHGSGTGSYFRPRNLQDAIGGKNRYPARIRVGD